MNYIGNDPTPGGLILVGDTNPVGMIGWFHTPPMDWLQLNGQSILKASYPDLWTFAQGFLTADQVTNPGLYKNIDGVSFAVPKLDGLFLRAGGQVDANHIAAALGVKQADDNVTHVHPPGAGAAYFMQTGGGGNVAYNAGPISNPISTNTGASGGTEARPVNVTLLPCVKAKKTTLIATLTTLPPANAGRLVQSRQHATGALVTGAVVIPFDDTIPQITEGAEYLLIANYIPLALGNRVRVSVEFNGTATVLVGIAAAIFKSSDVNAQAVSAVVVGGVDYEAFLVLTYEWIVDDLTARNWSLRAGPSGAATVRMNGRATRMMGGAYNSFLRMDEYSQ